MRAICTTTILSIFLLASSIASAQGAEKTLVKSFNLKGYDVVALQLEGNIEVKEWKSPILRVQIGINLPTGSSAMLKSLIQAGRYNLAGNSTADSFEISATNMQKKITVGGQELTEQLTYTIFAPADVQIKLINSTTANALNSAESF